MAQRHFRQLLEHKWSQGKFVCVGLDSDVGKLPPSVCERDGGVRKRAAEAIVDFNVAIVQATSDLVCAYKPNIAFYEALGSEGLEALFWTIHRICRTTDVPVILDYKRGDIGDTNQGYVRSAFEHYGADAVTVNPYFGGPEALKSFLSQQDKGIIVLCKTSNPGAEEFQDLEVAPGEKLYQRIAKNVAEHWNPISGNCALVVGATYPEALAEVRAIAPDVPLLIPGIGKQGGDLEKTVKAANGRMIINSSSGIIFASSGSDFAAAARRETLKLHNGIRAVLGLEVA